VQGTLKTDGTLELHETPRLPSGPVEVLIRVQPPPVRDGETWWEYLQRSRADLLAQGQTFRSKEQIDADGADQRRRDEGRRAAISHLQTPAE
jgi:hypothetical protein